MSEQEWPTDFPSPKDWIAKQFDDTRIPSNHLVPRETEEGGDLDTWLGKVVVGKPGEKWPTQFGATFTGVAQINLTNAPNVPDTLKDLAMITVFMPVDEEGLVDPFSDEDSRGAGLLIRSYSSLESLVPYDKPAPIHPGWTPRVCDYEVYSEFAPIWPNFSQLDDRYVKTAEDLFEAESEEGGFFANDRKEWRSKLGGYAAAVQDTFEEPIAFQLGSDEQIGFQWVDSGCIYVWRYPGKKKEWKSILNFG